jgi:hypothetical protein
MKINKKEIVAKSFAYDGCHKIYLLDNEEQWEDALANDYDVYPISKLQEKFESSCSLRFISPWDLSKRNYVNQFEDAVFEI